MSRVPEFSESLFLNGFTPVQAGTAACVDRCKVPLFINTFQFQRCFEKGDRRIRGRGYSSYLEVTNVPEENSSGKKTKQKK